MYKTGEAALDRILALVTKCPRELQGMCFEVLLTGYVQMEVGAAAAASPQPQQQLATRHESGIPQVVLSRFKAVAERIDVDLEKLEALFDFTEHPFSLQTVSVPGKNNADKTRSVALLAAAHTYLATGGWNADWHEVKSLCVEQNCYDLATYSITLKKGVGMLFKNVEPGKPIELSSAGIKEAEKLLRALAKWSPE
jgi:hypothetical protein